MQPHYWQVIGKSLTLDYTDKALRSRLLNQEVFFFILWYTLANISHKSGRVTDILKVVILRSV